MKKVNRERILLVTLVAVAFFGFLLFWIEKTSSEEIAIYSQSGQTTITPQAANAYIKVMAPKTNAVLASPATISGQAKVLSNKLRTRIKTDKGVVLAERYVNTANTKTMSDFSIALNFAKTSSTKGTVEIYQVSGTGAELYKISIPVNFK